MNERLLKSLFILDSPYSLIGVIEWRTEFLAGETPMKGIGAAFHSCQDLWDRITDSVRKTYFTRRRLSNESKPLALGSSLIAMIVPFGSTRINFGITMT